MEFAAVIFNHFGNEIVAKMMAQDKLEQNKPTKFTIERLYELSKTYDVTIRTRSGFTQLFLALQPTCFPGVYHE